MEQELSIEGTPSGVPSKHCTKCKELKPLEGFSKNSGKKDGLQSHCKSCNSAWAKNNPERRRDSWRRYRRDHYLRNKYGITDEEYWAMFEKQAGCCAICGDVGVEHLKHPDWQRPLHIDHDHKTGNVRGLLCHKCNAAIGLLMECPKRFASAMSYLGLD